MLIVENLCYRVGDFSLKEINLKIDRNGYFVLLGPTGSGKTTLIKCICGLCKASSGRILLGNRDITYLDPSERNIGFLPQDYSLFPHLDVEGNILFGPRIRNLNTKDTGERLIHLSRILGIENLMNRGVENLSGGEMQRVALARALIVQPEVLLLDEPFSSIDRGLRTRLWFEIKDILKQLDIIVIHITHDLDEASAIGDKIAVLISGKLEQVGTRDEVFLRPATEQVALYQGIKNIYDGEVIWIDKEKIKIECNGFQIVALKKMEFSINQKVKVCIRPQDIKIIKEGYPIRNELKDNLFEGEIISSYFCNDFCTIRVRGSTEFELRFPSYIYTRHSLKLKKRITIGIWQDGISIFRTG